MKSKYIPRMGAFVWGLTTGGLVGMPIKYLKTEDIFYMYMALGYFGLFLLIASGEYYLRKKEKKNGTVAKP